MTDTICCGCERHKWPDPQPVLHTDAEGNDYCLFHAPAEAKGMGPEEFNAEVHKWILAAHGRTAEDGKAETCHLSGAVFPWDMTFRGVCPENKLPPVTFAHAEFMGKANFFWATFMGKADFSRATFSGKANFFWATFMGKADFSRATFSGEAKFFGATFSHEANFFWATFMGKADFSRATFSHGAQFLKTTFSHEADFMRATFSREADFLWATFSGEAKFFGATFSHGAQFLKATFSHEADFMRATFSKPARFSYITASENALRMSELASESLANLHFMAAETDKLIFRRCRWPDQLLPERIARSEKDYLACEELYRSLKQKAVGQHDQPQASCWHFREKLMYKKQSWLRRYTPLSVTWWYWACSGFGERPVRAFLWLPAWAALALACFALLGHGWTWPPDWPAVASDVLRCIPLVRLPDVSPDRLPDLARVALTVLFQIILAAQAALCGFALRNKFRR